MDSGCYNDKAVFESDVHAGRGLMKVKVVMM